MKNFFLIAFCFAIALSACKKEINDCEDVVCQNGGQCNDGSCDCPTGFSGVFCENKTNNNNDSSAYRLGWGGDDDPTQIPVSVDVSDQFGSGQVPAAYDLTEHFPPIGDQGQFGTCVSWAVGYNYKTALEAMSNNWGASQLSQASNQLSPKYLFLKIDDQLKSPNCEGTNFEPALNVVLNDGIATVQTVPYQNLNGCHQSNIQSSWNSEASGHKISNYRRISQDVNTIKNYIADNVPVILGARLGDNFMNWNNDQVISSHSGFNNVGIHAYHAMVIVGYDDSKGSSGAFRVVNSWGDTWGDIGFIWIDYNFLINDFCFGQNLYVAADGSGDNPPNVNPNASGVDLAAWAFQDYSTDGGTGPNREIEYNIYNIGSQAASASSDWSMYYIYYNAYDANDYGFLFYNKFNTTIQQNTFNCNGSDCVINGDIPGGGDMASLIFNTSSIFQGYQVPNTLNGAYYLLIYADISNVFEEPNEQNNLFYTTSHYPAIFSNGVHVGKTGKRGMSGFSFPGNKPGLSEKRSSEFNSAVSKVNPNAYSPVEIKKMLLRDKQNGRFDQRLQAYKNSGARSQIRTGN
ncbi:MAG: C1 family peptidase [Chitinophagales bacterium]